MPLTELALLHLLPPTTSTTSSLLSTLSSAKTLMESYTRHHLYYLQQIEDPSYIYVLGEWDSLAQHYDEFIPGEENQGVLATLEGKLEVVWLMHLDVSQSELPGFGVGVSSIERHFVKAGGRGRFEEVFVGSKCYLRDFVTEGRIGGGWRVDKEEEGKKEEFVLFCPWKGVEQHTAFAETEGFKKYGVIGDVIGGADIKHVKVMDV